MIWDLSKLLCKNSIELIQMALRTSFHSTGSMFVSTDRICLNKFSWQAKKGKYYINM